MGKIKYGLQLFSVREVLKDDLAGTLSKISEMGYDGVEFFGEAPASPEELKSLLDEYGLECCGWHFWGDYMDLTDKEKLEKEVKLHHTIENENVVVSSVPEKYRGSKEGWKNIAENFNKIQESLKKYDLNLGYHNHDFEFKPINGELPWNILFDNTDTGITMQLDTGNAYKGGGKVVNILKDYADRAKTIHLKPYSFAKAEDIDDGFKTMIGEDDTPWEDIFGICESTGETEWYIIEYETDLYPPLEAVEKCITNVKKIKEKMN